MKKTDNPDKFASLLVIEDENEVRESYKDMFEYFGYHVDTAPDGRMGIIKLSQNNYDLVITDLNMPGMNGIEVLKHIKKQKPDIEVIVITGYATLENAVEAMKVGAYDYFTKPIDLEHVRIVISKCIREIKSRRENRELKSINARLKELNELKDKFITVTNHELRTPLAVIKGYFELVDLFTDSYQNDELEEILQIIKTTMEEMVNIVEHLHDMSYFDYGKKNFTKQRFEIAKTVETVFKEMKILFQSRSIHFNYNIEGEPVMFFGDEERIKRSIRELSQNALKFTPENGKVDLEFVQNPDSRNIYIRIKDTGIGIPREKHDLIFEPFYEVQDSMQHTSSKTGFMGGGIGLGLTLAKEVIQAHNGQILLESDQDKGSTFTIVLPYNEN